MLRGVFGARVESSIRNTSLTKVRCYGIDAWDAVSLLVMLSQPQVQVFADVQSPSTKSTAFDLRFHVLTVNDTSHLADGLQSESRY